MLDTLVIEIINIKNLFYLLTFILFMWYVYWRIANKHLIELGNKIPGPRGYPLVGNALEVLWKSHSEIFARFYKHSLEFTNKVVKVWAGPYLVVFLRDPDDIEIILSSHIYIDKATEYNIFKPWLGDGLLLSVGEKWRAHRKLIAPTFNLNILKSFIGLFNKNSQDMCNKLEKENGQEFDCHDYLIETTVEILLETVMGVNKETHGRGGFDYAMAVMKMCEIIHIRHTKLWARIDFIFNLSFYKKTQDKLLNLIHNFTRKVVQNKKEEFKDGVRGSIIVGTPNELNTKSSTPVEVFSSNLKDDLDIDEDIGEKKRRSFLEELMEASDRGIIITYEEMKEQVDTIMFEGHDTVAAAASFFLCQMAAHADIQEKCFRELQEIFGDSNRPATFADTLEMKYLERCLMETLRLFPPVPIVGRTLKEDVKLKSGYIVPAGCTLVISIFEIHRLAAHYPNPEKFDPDNFLPERTANRHHYAFIPFSAGPRSCVGRKYAILKLKILLSTILRNFIISSNYKEADYQLQADIILKRAEGFRIRVEPRKSKSV